MEEINRERPEPRQTRRDVVCVQFAQEGVMHHQNIQSGGKCPRQKSPHTQAKFIMIHGCQDESRCCSMGQLRQSAIWGHATMTPNSLAIMRTKTPRIGRSRMQSGHSIQKGSKSVGRSVPYICAASRQERGQTSDVDTTLVGDTWS